MTAMSADQTRPASTQQSRRFLVKRALQVAGALVVVVGFLAVAAAFIWTRGCPHHLRSVTEVSVRALRSAAETWRSGRGGGLCPTAEILRRDNAIDPASKLTDSWSHPFQITCEGNKVTVTSAGPDGRFGTADDIGSSTLASNVLAPGSRPTGSFARHGQEGRPAWSTWCRSNMRGVIPARAPTWSTAPVLVLGLSGRSCQ